MSLLRLHIGFIFLLCQVQMAGQISPGDLSQAHAHLEGMSNCTQCHTLGAKVNNDNCLDCHQFLSQRIDLGRGFHSSSQVRGKDCFSCHSEHHGRKFEMIRFNKEEFDHNWTGYELKGRHGKIDCRACHKDENIIDYEIKELSNTYLGLTTECLSCHDDYHHNTMSAKCQTCHTFDAFNPASAFDHDAETNFELNGKHKTVDCRACHTNEVEPWNYQVASFQSCVDCHLNPHEPRLAVNCTSCHNESGFQPMLQKPGFDHSTTGYVLQGAHARTSCFDCHSNKLPATIFLDFMDKNVNDCRLCHEDVHEGKLGENCLDCHNYDDFRNGHQMTDFNHNLTDFPLKGLHDQVTCQKCHQGDLTRSMPHERCLDCHTDGHNGQIVDVQQRPKDCKECHSEDGFDLPKYGLEEHSKNAFPLEGGHLATPCFACHMKEDDWIYKDLNQQCISCHENIHKGTISDEFMGVNDCILCHSSASWSSVSFDHATTNFGLKGKHIEVSCAKCHFDVPASSDTLGQKFKGLSHNCFDCHDDLHRGQFANQGITDCASCHSEDGWTPSQFDHQFTQFPLDGGHANLNCVKCHNEVEDENGFFVSYKIERFECQDCHGQ